VEALHLGQGLKVAPVVLAGHVFLFKLMLPFLYFPSFLSLLQLLLLQQPCNRCKEHLCIH